MSGITSSTALWYASRATGIVCLVLLTAVMVLGIIPGCTATCRCWPSASSPST